MDFSFVVILLQLLVGGEQAVDLLDARAYWELHGVQWSRAAIEPLTAAPDTSQADAAAAQLMAATTDAEAQAAAQALLALGEQARAPIGRLCQHERQGVRVVAEMLLQELDKQRGARPPLNPTLHRLMAIKALGALRDPAAKPRLEALSAVADDAVVAVATRALGRLAGERAPPADPPPSELAPFLNALPAESNVVLHLAPIPGAETVPTTGGIRLNVRGLNLTGGDDARQTPRLAEIFGLIGNLRFRGALLGLRLEADRVAGGAMIMRGDFDGDLLLSQLARLSAEPEDREPLRIGDRPALWLSGIHSVVVLAAPDLLLVTFVDDMTRQKAGDAPADADAEPAAELVLAQSLTAAYLAPPAEPPLAALLADVTRDGPIWGAMAVPADADWGADWHALRSVTLATEAREGICHCDLRGHGHDPATAAALADDFTRTLDGARAEWDSGLGALPIGRPITKLLASVAISAADDGTLAGRAELNPAIISMLPMIALLFDSDNDTDEPADPAAPPANPKPEPAAP